MADNIYWDQNPVAVMPTMPTQSLQELAYAPQIMYEREKDAVAKMNALNESKNTLNAVLGDKAVLPEKFNAEYQAVLDEINKTGATPRNIERASKLRSLYATEVKPIEKFATDREKWIEAYMKEAMDQNNIIVGSKPSDVTYDQYKSNPSSLQFSVLGRDKLMSQGLLNGKEIAKSHTREWNTSDGYHHIQEGFGSAAEAMNAYQNNTNKFRDQVESRVKDLASAAGAAGHPEVEASIRQGILSSVVGDQKIMAIPGWGTGARGGAGQQRDMTQLITETRMGAPTDKPYETVKRMPEMSAARTDLVLKNPDLTSRGISSAEDLDSVISFLENSQYITEPFKSAEGLSGMADAALQTAGRAVGTAASFLAGEYKEPSYSGLKLSDLKAYRDKIDSSAQGHEWYAGETLLRPNAVVASYNPELYAAIKKSEEAVGADINSTIESYSTNRTGVWGATTQDGQKALKKFAKLDPSGREVIFKGVRVNAVDETDSSGKRTGRLMGSGYPTVIVELFDKDKKTGDEITMHLPWEETSRALYSVARLSQNNPDQAARMQQYIDLMQKYYQQEAQSLQQQK